MTGYANPEFDAIAEEAAVETDQDARMEKIHELQEIFARDIPAVVLYYPHGNYAYRPAAYDGWVEDPGHGHFTKRSFLAAADTAADEPAVEATEAETEEPAAEEDEGVAAELPDAGAGVPWVWIIVGLLLVAAVVAVLARRRGAEEEY
jgi:hypothetical protein